MRRRIRLVLFSVLMGVPALLIIGVGGFFICTEVPKMASNEARRVTMSYRTIADALRKDRGARYYSKRRSGWRQLGKINGVSWGRSAAKDGKVLIWYQSNPSRWRIAETDELVEENYAPIFYCGGIAVALVLAGLTFLAILNFIKGDKARDDFLAATAHDLTTPLVGMRMMIGRNDEEAKRLNERMLLIVSNIKDFLKLGGKRRKPELKPVDIAALVKEAYQLFAADYEDSEGGEVVFDSSRVQSTPVEVLADEAMALQILWNLFGNDLKYAAPYGKVAVRFAQDGRFVRVEFADEGQGMTPRQMKRAFDRYYRARTVLESGKGGFGIGLCTAREFARAMGGDLTVRANDPKGCVFARSLPFRP